MYRDGEEGHIGVRIRGDMEFNNRRNVFAHNESQVVIDYLSKHYCNLSFLNYCFVKTLPQGLLCVHIRDGGYRLSRVRLWIGLPPSWIRNVGGPWARVWPIPNQMIEEALIWTLKDSFPTKFIDYVAETWRELFRFITATMMGGLRRENTGTWDLKSLRPQSLGISRDWDDVKWTLS